MTLHIAVNGFFWDKPENPFKAIDVPTLFIWGKHDIAVTEKSAKLNSGYFKNNYKIFKIYTIKI